VRDTNEAIYAPTLEEAIEACGFDFRDLSQHSKRTSESTHYRWLVKGGKRVFGKWRLFSGKTAIEAVAKLWLALNKNETPHHQAW